MISTCSKTARQSMSCRVRDGLVVIDGRERGYYASRSGAQMLVVERCANQRIRINDAIEVVVLEIGNGRVQLGVVRSAESDADD